MSRMTRREHVERHQPRTTVKKLLAAAIARLPKQPKASAELNKYRWSGGTILAHTRSQARAQIKRQLGLKRLPPHFHIEHL